MASFNNKKLKRCLGVDKSKEGKELENLVFKKMEEYCDKGFLKRCGRDGYMFNFDYRSSKDKVAAPKPKKIKIEKEVVVVAKVEYGIANIETAADRKRKDVIKTQWSQVEARVERDKKVGQTWLDFKL